MAKKKQIWNKEDLGAFVQERADEFKKLAHEKGYNEVTTISAAFNTAMFVIADMYADEEDFDKNDINRNKFGFYMAEQFIDHIGKRFQKKNRKRKRMNEYGKKDWF